jgi:hypothetical protein
VQTWDKYLFVDEGITLAIKYGYRFSKVISILKITLIVTNVFRFFAESWKHAQPPLPQVVEAVFLDFHQRLDVLSQSLPSRFAEILQELCLSLPIVFSKSYPFVLIHDDLCKMNILVDPESGNISGIIDWADVKVLPFGILLWGLKNVLGYMDSKGWHYYDKHKNLKTLFWQTFEDITGPLSDYNREIIRITRMVGFFFRYGFTWDSGIRERPVGDSDSSLIYLDAYLETKTQFSN